MWQWRQRPPWLEKKKKKIIFLSSGHKGLLELGLGIHQCMLAEEHTSAYVSIRQHTSA
jgi:hypothetical protein